MKALFEYCSTFELFPPGQETARQLCPTVDHSTHWRRSPTLRRTLCPSHTCSPVLSTTVLAGGDDYFERASIPPPPRIAAQPRLARQSCLAQNALRCAPLTLGLRAYRLSCRCSRARCPHAPQTASSTGASAGTLAAQLDAQGGGGSQRLRAAHGGQVLADVVRRERRADGQARLRRAAHRLHECRTVHNGPLAPQCLTQPVNVRTCRSVDALPHRC